MPADDVSAEDQVTYLGGLRELLAARRTGQERVVRLRDTRSRPEFVIECRVPSDADEQRQVQRRAEQEEKKKNAPPGGLILACMTLAHFAVGLTLNGQPLTPEGGSPFTDPDLQAEVGTSRAWLTVRALFDDDFAVMRLWESLMREAGIGADGVVVSEADDEADPT